MMYVKGTVGALFCQKSTIHGFESFEDGVYMIGKETERIITLDHIDESDELCCKLADEVIELAGFLEVEVPGQQAVQLVQHLLYVQQVNSYMNLTRIVNLHEALILHIVDSVALTRSLPFVPDRFLDMGTGAGFPGIPFHILTGCNGVLLDSVGKKIKAVDAFIRELCFEGIAGVHDRLESYACSQRETFDMVCARAVGQLPMIIEYGAPFLEHDGFLMLAKAHPSHEELVAGDRTADLCGLERIGCDEFELPEGMGHRSVLFYQKVDEPRIVLPRPVGEAKRNPLT